MAVLHSVGQVARAQSSGSRSSAASGSCHDLSLAGASLAERDISIQGGQHRNGDNCLRLENGSAGIRKGDSNHTRETVLYEGGPI